MAHFHGRSYSQPIRLDDDNDEVEVVGERTRITEPVYDLTEEEAEAQFDGDVLQDAGLLLDNNWSATYQQHTRNTLPDAPEAIVQSCRVDGQTYSVGDAVELAHHDRESRNGDFLLITQIIQNLASDSTVAIRGYLLRRHCYMKVAKGECGMLALTLNEVHMLLNVDYDDRRSIWQQGMVSIAPSQIVCRRELVLTNQLSSSRGRRRPDFSFRDDFTFDGSTSEGKEIKAQVFKEERLVCRWIFVLRFPNAEKRLANRYEEAELRRLMEKDLRALSSIALHGSAKIKPVKDYLIYLSSQNSLPEKSQAIRFGDCFCGGGGMSEAAARSGAVDKIVFGFDNDPTVLETYRANRDRDTRVICREASEMLPLLPRLNCDILHSSTPCQSFSPANTRGDRNSEHNQQNETAFFTTRAFLDKSRPRVFTLEQTFGIITHYPEWFNCLIGFFTELNYSVRWRNIDFRNYGLAQRRSRLIVFASCPGTEPPRMPRPTHGPTTNVAWTTVHDVLSRIPGRVSHNSPRQHAQAITRPPYDANTQLVCITRGGGDPTRNYHPTGSRTFTVRELACFQGFRPDFILPESTTRAKHIIGNAVPPSAMAVLLSGMRVYLNDIAESLQASAAEVVVIEE